jgi:hypothetical protein
MWRGTPREFTTKKPPFVNHDEGTELVIQQIDKYWCPSVLSEDLSATGEAATLPSRRDLVPRDRKYDE